MKKKSNPDRDDCNSSAGLLRPGGSVAVAARSTAAATATASLAVTAATPRATASTTAASAAAGLAFTTSAGAATTASGLTSDLVETVIGLSRDFCTDLLARCLGVPGLAGKVACSRVVGPAGGLRLRCNVRGCCRCVNLLVGSWNDLVALVKTLLLSASSCVPALASDVALRLDSGARVLFRGGRNTIGLRLLELGQTGVCSGGIGARRNSIFRGRLRCGLDVGRERCVRDSGLLDLRDCNGLLARVLGY